MKHAILTAILAIAIAGSALAETVKIYGHKLSPGDESFILLVEDTIEVLEIKESFIKELSIPNLKNLKEIRILHPVGRALNFYLNIDYRQKGFSLFLETYKVNILPARTMVEHPDAVRWFNGIVSYWHFSACPICSFDIRISGAPPDPPPISISRSKDGIKIQ